MAQEDQSFPQITGDTLEILERLQILMTMVDFHLVITFKYENVFQSYAYKKYAFPKELKI